MSDFSTFEEELNLLLEENPNARVEIIEYIKSKGFDHDLAITMLGDVVTCIKDHYGIPANTRGYISAAHHMSAGFSFLSVDWKEFGESDNWTYTKSEFFEFVTTDNKKFDNWESL